jgi:Cu2+-exporting ATPase
LDWYGDTASLAFAAELEQQIQHPIAIAIQDFAREQLPTPNAISSDADDIQTSVTEFEHINGRGLRGRIADRFICVGNEAWMVENAIALDTKWIQCQAEILSNSRTAVWIAVDGEVRGLMGIGDSLRSDAITTLRDISAQGWRIGILSGDRQEIVDALAQNLRDESVSLVCALGNQLPEQKLDTIRRCKDEHQGPCVMVGDGVNDAAAMALADVGIAIRGASEQALYAAPIFLANQRLSSVVELMRSSKSVVRGIKRCFAASLLYNTFTIGLAVCGLIHPLIAAILMPISGVTVLTMAITTRSFQKS